MAIKPMLSIPTKSSNPAGLHQRYVVTKSDGKGGSEPADPEAVYFVLRLDAGGSDSNHVRACQEAALAYARSTNNELMATELVELVSIHRGVLAARGTLDLATKQVAESRRQRGD